MGGRVRKDDVKRDIKKNAPKFPYGCQLYFDAFYSLDSDRPAAMEGLMPIPSVAILHYCKAMGMDSEQAQFTFYVVRRMDIEYLKIKNPKSKGKLGGANTGDQKSTKRPRRIGQRNQ